MSLVRRGSIAIYMYLEIVSTQISLTQRPILKLFHTYAHLKKTNSRLNFITIARNQSQGLIRFILVFLSLSDDKQADIIDAFNTTSRYLDDILNNSNVNFLTIW